MKKKFKGEEFLYRQDKLREGNSVDTPMKTIGNQRKRVEFWFLREGTIFIEKYEYTTVDGVHIIYISLTLTKLNQLHYPLKARKPTGIKTKFGVESWSVLPRQTCLETAIY